MSSPAPIEHIAQQNFGFAHLRPGQEAAIRSILDGHDTLVIHPTGSGKSAIYQIAGLMIPGATVVVSPLIALQKDQLDSINSRHVPDGDAAIVNSLQRTNETRETFQKLKAGNLEYLFLAPEQLRKPDTLQKLRAANISLFVIDEAHCITEWGHDFRPDYLHLAPVIEALGHPVVLAMTATASPDVREEITERLRLRNPQVFVHPFDRPNISLRVDHFKEEQDKFEAIVHRVRWAEKPGIVYACSRKNAEALMGALADEGVHAVFYHAGLKAKERTSVQEQFMSGAAEVIVATNAFGMGVDKENVRFVYHYDISDSLDAYYQEIGRAGRDGKPAEAVLFYRHQNLGTRKFQLGAGKLERNDIERVAAAMCDADRPVDACTITEITNLSERKVIGAMHRLEDVGAAQSLPTGKVEFIPGVDLATAVQTALQGETIHQQRKRRRLEQMQTYPEISSCRRQRILRYFGDSLDAGLIR